MAETVAEILEAYRSGAARPEDIVARSYARIRAHDDPAIFISLRDEAELLAEARALQQAGKTSLPLYGIPVAVKDNIDVKGLPTTAACPAYSYRPNKDAACVAKLREAGALVIGKTNLDQFATGLVGVRTPYGIGRNLFDPKLIPGGSSTGSALAVGAGLVPLSLGTDTAGSGRVPAAFANVVGLKPSRGLVSNAGVVPACRTLDCVSAVRAHRRRCDGDAECHCRTGCKRSVRAAAAAGSRRADAGRAAARRAACRSALVLRRPRIGAFV